ncbi:MAG: hypothetical protein A2Y64_02885 [Candidatus Coatesbacteria bacterium RBG_13_66_14]|uniref:Carboxypeptidase regulatory-like domain-containing protein n=1 Tax=Candidatus Coatesbacteria bacterium RBG_13_66_14 TaxID=1817816 RepID=A0A1F5FAZ0_9BACT|nr:MAG: hypothetical protein A2Y64_02885 [Candidatus Coatesbacteria bacterium RBG_13_66_14]
MRTAALLLLTLVLLAGCKDGTGTLTGRVTDEYDRAVSGAVILLDGTDYKATTNSDGRYAITGVEPGSYTLTGIAPDYDFDILHEVTVGGDETVTIDLAAHSRDYLEPVRKPNIYLYPSETTDVSVTLSFPRGGGVTISEPMYLDGWKVEATPAGVLTRYERVSYPDPSVPASAAVNAEPVPTGAYTYLFYEADVPVEWQREYGWLVEVEELGDFFAGNLAAYGFDDREIRDFLDYWEPRLTAGYYAVFPQLAADIEPLIGLDVQPEPDSVLRLYYYLVANPNFGGELAPPEIPRFSREGFTVVEWGVILQD